MKSRCPNDPMTQYTPTVRATVIDIKSDQPKQDDRFLVDTQVWYWLTYTRSEDGTHPPKEYQVEEYPNYIQQSIASKIQLFWSGLAITELITLIERSEYDIFCKKQNRTKNSFSLKDYRHGEAQARSEQVIPEINIAWEAIQRIGTCLEAHVNQEFIIQSITNLNIQSTDGYDSLMIDSAKAAGITQIITDDIDFLTVPGIQVFTANKKALMAASNQQKLINRPITPYQKPKAKSPKLKPENP